ncbi:DUF6300 family protein [Streptomyces longwoodensis]|uniref:DUF6300 family protein n=1 Tax=Streptomyces longwoodensis TaxID=68231 RepID=UPI00224CC408|nr:DUF6300 family protein [Streptomyces longwoodensis]MCX5000959.1 DUF6300 family protein [Streptomyces longwoodensis]
MERSEALPPCSRCGGRLMMSAIAPQKDAQGQPIHLELCPSCDTGNVERPAAGLLLQFLGDGGAHDEKRIREAAHLMMEWTKEGMAVHGWYLADSPPADT